MLSNILEHSFEDFSVCGLREMCEDLLVLRVRVHVKKQL